MSNSSLSHPPRIGEVLVAQGKLSREQAGEAAKHSVEYGMRFGEAAVALGFVQSNELEEALAKRAPVPTFVPGEMARSIVMWHRPNSPEAEDYRSLRSALALRWFQGAPPRRALSVISAGRYDGKSTLLANLAVSFGLAGAQTLLVDADLRQPKQHMLFGLSNKTGLANILDQSEFNIPHYAIAGVENLMVMVAGRSTDYTAQELLLKTDFLEYLNIQMTRYDIVLVDTSAASLGNDYQIAAKITEGALLVTREKRTRIQRAIEMLNACDDVGIKVVGGTMVKDHDRSRPSMLRRNFSKMLPRLLTED